MTQPTIKDVARLADVSISTVSRVMNNSKPVSPEVKERVQDAIDKLGFKPNELARSLVMRKSHSIGILVKDIAIPHMAQMIRGAEEIGRMYDYDILLTSTYGEKALEKRAVDFLYRKQVEGVIVISDNISSDIIMKIKEYNIPYFLLDPYYRAGDYPTVRGDRKRAMVKLCEYLYSNENRRILYLSSGIETETAKMLEEGIRSFIKDKDDVKVAIEEAESYDYEAGYQVGKDLKELVLDKDYDVIVCENDLLAVGLLNFFYDQGIQVPDQVQVTGFGGYDMASIVRPTLTTIHVPFYDIGAVAMRLLTKSLSDDDEAIDETVFLPSQLVVGNSTRKIE